MGLLSSSSSSNTQNLYDTTESNVATSNEGQTIVGKNNSVTFTDYDAVQRAFNFAESNNAYVGESMASVLGYTEKIQSNAISKIASAYSSANNAVDINRLAIYGAVIGGLFLIFRGT